MFNVVNHHNAASVITIHCSIGALPDEAIRSPETIRTKSCLSEESK